MLDRRTSALLQTINDFCASGTYKVFSSEDFLASFPEKWGVTSESLAQMLGYLSENGYINIKYSGSGMYCVCPLPLGRSYCERVCGRRAGDPHVHFAETDFPLSGTWGRKRRRTSNGRGRYVTSQIGPARAR